MPLRAHRGVWQNSRAVPAGARLDQGLDSVAGTPREAAFRLGVEEGSLEDLSSDLTPLPRTFGAARASLELQGAAELDGADGELSSQRAGLDLSFGWRGDAGTYSFHARSESSFYDFGVDDSFLAGRGDPFNDVYLTSFGAEAELDANADIGFLIGGEFTFAGEDEVDLRDSLQVGAIAGARMRPTEDVQFTFGLAGQTRLENEPWVVPYLGLEWQMSERLLFAAEGSEIAVRYRMNDAWTVGTDARYEWRNYRLNEDGPLEGGAFHDEEISLGAHATWAPREDLEVRFGIAKTLWRELEFRTDNSSELAEIEAPDGNWIGFSVRLSF